MSAENSVRLDRMIESGEAVLEYAEAGREKFLRDRELYDAIMWRLSNFTEEAEKLCRPLSRVNPHLNWRKLTAWRQRFHHGYAAIEPEEVWRFIDQQLPRIVSNLRRASVTERES